MLTVDNLNFRINPHQVLQFNGKIPSRCCLLLQQPSGCGKSTFFHLITGLITPESGSYSWDKLTSTEASEKGFGVAIQYQDNRLFDFLSVSMNIALGWQGNGKLNQQQQTIMQRMLAMLDLTALADKPCDMLSGGELRRVAILRAVGKACRFRFPLLLLDEPMAGLDRRNRNRVIDLLQLLRNDLLPNLTMIVASHQHANWQSLQPLTPGTKYLAIRKLSSPQH